MKTCSQIIFPPDMSDWDISRAVIDSLILCNFDQRITKAKLSKITEGDQEGWTKLYMEADTEAVKPKIEVKQTENGFLAINSTTL
jgi:hypothetical protein